MQQNAENAYGEFLDALAYDWRNDNQMKDTPKRVAKMYIKEICNGSHNEKPKITTFKNEEQYDQMVFQGNIPIKSLCAHHIMPFIGQGYVAYIPSPTGSIIGLSKINRIVDWYMRRPQLQEALTMQIHDEINNLIGDNLGIAVVIKAKHTCVSLRGIEHDSTMQTSKLSGVFLNSKENARHEFYEFIKNIKE